MSYKDVQKKIKKLWKKSRQGYPLKFKKEGMLMFATASDKTKYRVTNRGWFRVTPKNKKGIV